MPRLALFAQADRRQQVFDALIGFVRVAASLPQPLANLKKIRPILLARSRVARRPLDLDDGDRDALHSALQVTLGVA